METARTAARLSATPEAVVERDRVAWRNSRECDTLHGQVVFGSSPTESAEEVCKGEAPSGDQFPQEEESELAEDLEALFRTWLGDHGGAVLKVARAYTMTTEECQDLVQEILLQIWSSLPRFQGASSPATWCYRVALNTALDWHRQEHRRRTRRQPTLEVEQLSVAAGDCGEQLIQREAVERLYVAIRRLPKTDAAIVLLYLDGLGYRDMAEILGISEGNVGVKLTRARSALSSLMREEEPHG